jgi:hypothetical protein
MKRLLPALGFALILSCVVSVPNASARDWWWHRHHKDSANNSASSKPPKAKKERHHRHEKASPSGETTAMSNGPRSVGHWHPMPGPAGAGAY